MLKNEKLKEARKSAGYTQIEFAEKLGTNQAYVSALETRNNFSMDVAVQIGKILKVDPNELMIDESGSILEVDREAIVKNVLAFLKRKDIKIVDLIKDLGVSRTAFYYQIKSENMKQSFKDAFQKATGFNIMDIINEKQF